jgi:hypothetical protein
MTKKGTAKSESHFLRDEHNALPLPRYTQGRDHGSPVASRAVLAPPGNGSGHTPGGARGGPPRPRGNAAAEPSLVRRASAQPATCHVRAGHSIFGACTPEPCAQVRILLGAPVSDQAVTRSDLGRDLIRCEHAMCSHVPAEASRCRHPWSARGPGAAHDHSLRRALSIPQSPVDVVEPDLIMINDAFRIYRQQHLNAMPSPLSYLASRDACIQPQGHTGMSQIVWTSRER